MIEGPDIAGNIRDAEKNLEAAAGRLLVILAGEPSEERERLAGNVRHEMKTYAIEAKHWRGYLKPGETVESSPPPAPDSRLPREAD